MAPKRKLVRKRRRVWRRKPRVQKSISLIKPTPDNPRSIGVPEILKVRLQYGYTPFRLYNGSGPYASTTFAINNLNDIDYSGSGVQPPLYDNLSAIYDKYRVVGARIRVDYFANNACILYMRYMGREMTDVSNLLTYDFTQGVSTYMTMGSSIVSGEMKQLSKTFDLTKLELEYHNSNFSSNTGGAPNTPLYIQIGQYRVDGTVTNCDGFATVHIELDCEFFDNKVETIIQD